MKKETIVLKKITKSFKAGDNVTHVLKGVTFTAYEKELIILMGPSGSGKTTLISIIGGILDQDEGECLVLGKQMKTMGLNEKTKFRGENIGFLFQHFMLIPSLDSIENAAIPLLCMGHDRAQSYDKASKLLLSLDLEAQQYKKPSQLSGGEQQRVAIARSCLHNPKIILCDEPTSFLDLERGKKVMHILKTIKDTHNCTVVVITHDPRILEFADKVIHMEDGILVDDNN